MNNGRGDLNYNPLIHRANNVLQICIKFILHPVVLLHSPGLFFKSNTRIKKASLTSNIYIHSVFMRSLVIIKPFLTINTPFLNPNLGVIKFFAHHNPVSLPYAQG